MAKIGPYRDGEIHVLSDKCSTCVFRPGNLMHLSQGRLKDLVESNRKVDSALVCHQTLPYNDTGADPAICRGYYDQNENVSTPLRLAKVLGIIRLDEPPTKKGE